MNEFWFKPKRTGYGCVPSTREGWALTIAYALAIIGGEAAIFLVGPTTGRLLAFLAAATVLTAMFLVICYKKTDGAWRWRRKGLPE